MLHPTVPTFVQRTHLTDVLPDQYLSSRTDFPSNSSESYEMQCTISCGVDQSPTVYQIERHLQHPTVLRLDPLLNSESYQAMLRSEEQTANGRPTRASRRRGQHLQALFRSASAIDLQDLAKSTIKSIHNTSDHGSRETSNLLYAQQPPTIDRFRQFPTNSKSISHRQAALNPTLEYSTNEKRLRRKLQYKSYQDLHILSMYQDDDSVRNIESSTSSDGLLSDCDSETVFGSSESSSSSGGISPIPRTPADENFLLKPPHGKDVTDIAVQTECPNIRQVQILEYRQPFRDAEVAAENGMPFQATVLTVPGKPRLIQIHRPRHSDQPLQIESSQSHIAGRPTTPVRSHALTSTLSPCNMPDPDTPFSDLSRTASQATPTPNAQPKLSIRTNTDMFQTFNSILSSGRSFNILEVEKLPRSLADPFGSPSSPALTGISDASSLIDDSPSDSSLSCTLDNQSVSAPSVRSFVLPLDVYRTKLKEAITSTHSAIEATARQELTIDSLDFCSFRCQPPSPAWNAILIKRLQAVFPRASPSSLSTLTAWLVIDEHFRLLFDSAPLSTYEPPSNERSPANGMRHVPRHRSDRKSYYKHKINYEEIFPSPNRQTSNHRNVSSPLNAGQVPSKARLVLGISADFDQSDLKSFCTSDSRCMRSLARSTEEQARSVHSSVQDMGFKLIKDLTQLPLAIELSAKQKSVRLKHKRGRSSTQSALTWSLIDEVMEGAIVSLWEACRQIVARDSYECF